MNKIVVEKDEKGNKIVVIPCILFKGKRTIDWKEVEKYLKRYVGKIVEVTDTGDVVYIGSDFPDEYANSNYTKNLRGAYAKVKANMAQGIKELIQSGENKRWIKNYKKKHNRDARNGWYYYRLRFALPVMGENEEIKTFNIYQAVLLVRSAKDDKLYLYDIVDIKKETSKPL